MDDHSINKKPILFHNIDGVLFGDYAGQFQLRPGVKTWLTWAHQHFRVVWLTSWDKEHIEQLLDLLHIREFLPVHYANWMKYETKALWLKEARPKITENRAVFWIDDEVEKVDGVIEILVNRVGERELESLRERLSALLAKPRLVA
jgi:hypothetical protein